MKTIIFAAAVLAFAVAVSSLAIHQSSPTTNVAAAYTTHKADHAIDAAEVGDKVVPSHLTVACGTDADAFEVLYAVKVARSEHHRLKGYGDVWGLIAAENAAREAAVRRAYSCTIIHRFTADPLRVEQKRVSGKPGDLFQTVTYTLRQDDNLFYVKVEQDGRSPFEPVKRPKVAAQQAADQVPFDKKMETELARRDAEQTPDQKATWKSAVAAKLGQHKQYPLGAPADGGKAQVNFKLDREGKVISSRIVNSSGSDVLDQEALDMVQRASPFPAPPDSLESPVELTVPVRFSKQASR
jgi:TonB family protein